MKNIKLNYQAIDLRLTAFSRQAFMPVARFSLFLIFFWFGAIKLLGLSPVSPLVEVLTTKTVGMQYFDGLFFSLAIVECIIGILFLFPKATRIVIPLLLLHIIIVSSPLLLVPEYTWRQFGVLTLEGQYIIKNIALIAVAIGIYTSAVPLKANKT